MFFMIFDEIDIFFFMIFISFFKWRRPIDMTSNQEIKKLLDNNIKEK